MPFNNAHYTIFQVPFHRLLQINSNKMLLIPFKTNLKQVRDIHPFPLLFSILVNLFFSFQPELLCLLSFLLSRPSQKLAIGHQSFNEIN